MRFVCVELGRCAVAADLLVTQINIDLLWLDLYSAAANGGENASPVGISPGPGGFYQWRIGNSAGDLSRLIF